MSAGSREGTVETRTQVLRRNSKHSQLQSYPSCPNHSLFNKCSLTLKCKAKYNKAFRLFFFSDICICFDFDWNGCFMKYRRKNPVGVKGIENKMDS